MDAVGAVYDRALSFDSTQRAVIDRAYSIHFPIPFRFLQPPPRSTLIVSFSRARLSFKRLNPFQQFW
jgi:hypothetical protein